MESNNETLVIFISGLKSFDEFQSVCAYCRDRVNPYLFIYAMSVAVLHRPDTKNLQIPSLCEIFPEKFMDSSVFLKAREEAIVVPTASRVSYSQEVVFFFKKKKI